MARLKKTAETTAAPKKAAKTTKAKKAPAVAEAATVETVKASEGKTEIKPVQTETAPGSVCVALNYPTQLTFDVKGDRRVTLNGNAEALRGKSQGHIPMGAFGLTVISAEDWEYIRQAYGKMRIFRNGLCFATSHRTDTEAEAQSRAGLRHGREAAAIKGGGVQEADKSTVI